MKVFHQFKSNVIHFKACNECHHSKYEDKITNKQQRKTWLNIKYAAIYTTFDNVSSTLLNIFENLNQKDWIRIIRVIRYYNIIHGTKHNVFEINFSNLAVFSSLLTVRQIYFHFIHLNFLFLSHFNPNLLESMSSFLYIFAFFVMSSCLK